MLWIELEHEGVTGFGEAQPQDHYGETIESAEAFLDGSAPLLGDDPFALEVIGARLAEIPGEHAAKAGLDGALHDLCGKLSASPSGACSASSAAGLRPPGRSGSGIPTTWPAARKPSTATFGA